MNVNLIYNLDTETLFNIQKKIINPIDQSTNELEKTSG